MSACAAALAALTGVLRFPWDDTATEGVPVSAIGALVSVAALVADVLRGDADPVLRSADEDRRRAADALAEAVREQWAAEVRLRRLQDPEPIEVGWAPADRRLADHPENLGRGGRLPAPRARRVEDLAAWFAGLPGRRLVVLGGPGRTSSSGICGCGRTWPTAAPRSAPRRTSRPGPARHRPGRSGRAATGPARRVRARWRGAGKAGRGSLTRPHNVTETSDV
ncbi:hypothetical protein ACIQVK_11885 [Streptomyces sp. NPDC090493]|uniref:hypothetical protein n=1 Tax=Streptomyces sp. NPDC090493 TaxID=3365964 RepID=UPI0038076A6A